MSRALRRHPYPLLISGTAFLAAAAVLVFGLVASANAHRAAPSGPRLTFIEAQFPHESEADSEPPAALRTTAGKSLEALSTNLFTVAADGSDRQTMLAGSARLEPAPAQTAPSWVADGREAAFVAYASAGKKPSGGIYLIDADGGGLRRVPGTGHAQEPVISPDGHWIAFSRGRGYEESTTWIIAAAGGKPRQLTPWVKHQFQDPSGFSAGGTRLLLTVSPPHRSEEIDSYDLASGRVKTVERQASHGVYSPDGSKLAFVSYRDGETVSGFDRPEPASELYVANADGSHPRRITHTPKLEEQAPNWDPSGRRIAFTRYPGGLLEFLGFKAVIAEVNADGTCPTVVATPESEPGHRAAIYAPAWQPGPGRGAGPLTC